jgi:cell fate regulator YaaT (PSP1 superfamily)
MGDYRDDHNGQSEEDLGRLEDSHDGERERPSGKATDPRELPRPLYRIKATHSNETFYAYFPKPRADAGSPRPAAETGQPLVEAEPPAPSGVEAPPAAESPEAIAAATEAEAGEIVPETRDIDDGEAKLRIGPSGSRTMVVVPTRYGRDICELQGEVAEPGQVSKDDIVPIERIATPDDLRKVEANRERERKAFETCKQKIAARGLPMKLVSAHYLLEEPKVLFYFSAESRVDFRELVKDLVAVFKIRIELRQIGVRDEARVTGGCGVCGRVLCCHGVTDKLVPVSIKMAKDQNLSLNSMKISGPCGRLLCCLAYEYGFYRDARRELPNEGARFQYDGVLFRVIEVNALSGSVKISGEDGRLLDMPSTRFAYAEGRWRIKEEENKDDKVEKEEEK